MSRKSVVVDQPSGHLPEVDFSLLESVPGALIISHRDGRIAHVSTMADQFFCWASLAPQPTQGAANLPS